jgi:Protein-tyrosine phosphatase
MEPLNREITEAQVIESAKLLEADRRLFNLEKVLFSLVLELENCRTILPPLLTNSPPAELSVRVNCALSLFINNFAFMNQNALDATINLLEAAALTDLFNALPQEMQLYHQLAKQAKSSEFSGDFSSFPVNTHMYHAYGPCWMIDGASNQIEAVKSYISSIKNFNLIINLIEVRAFGDPCHYIKYDSFKDLYFLSEEESSEDYDQYNSKNPENRLIHFHGWPDSGLPNQLLSCLKVAKKVVEAQQRKESIFINCMAGFQRTCTFIVICELLMHADTVMLMDNDTIREFMKQTILQMTNTVPQRYPSVFQVKFLLGNLFIDFVRKNVPNC